MISMIAAVASNGVIGLDNAMPWTIPADLKWFKRITMGKPIVMGRKTWESIGRPLPGRKNIVLSRSCSKVHPKCLVLSDIQAILDLSTPNNEIMIIGGGNIYSLFFPYVTRLYLTEIEGNPEGDTWFPSMNKEQWTVQFEESHQADNDNSAHYTFKILDLKNTNHI